MGLFNRSLRLSSRRNSSRLSLTKEKIAINEIPSLVTLEVPPHTTDQEITGWLDCHFVAIDPSVNSLNKLFIFFCGSRGIPARTTTITKYAASLGYHAINLTYPNSWTIGGICQDSEDSCCHGNARLDIWDGSDRSGLLKIGKANSIINRVLKLLVYLDHHFPDHNWARFLSHQGLDWPSIVLAGHSQGGGQAAIIAKYHPCARVIMFSSPVDYVRRKQVHASWLKQPGVTPAGRYYGFVHVLDPGLDKILKAWELLKMDQFGPVADVDRFKPPFDFSQRLISSYGDIPRSKYHNCVVQDFLTPVSQTGYYIYQCVWEYLLKVNV